MLLEAASCFCWLGTEGAPRVARCHGRLQNDRGRLLLQQPKKHCSNNKHNQNCCYCTCYCSSSTLLTMVLARIWKFQKGFLKTVIRCLRGFWWFLLFYVSWCLRTFSIFYSKANSVIFTQWFMDLWPKVGPSRDRSSLYTYQAHHQPCLGPIKGWLWRDVCLDRMIKGMMRGRSLVSTDSSHPKEKNEKSTEFCRKKVLVLSTSKTHSIDLYKLTVTLHAKNPLNPLLSHPNGTPKPPTGRPPREDLRNLGEPASPKPHEFWSFCLAFSGAFRRSHYWK